MPATRWDLAGDPPESTQLRIGEDEFTWSDINGVYDRDDSLKENTNPKCLLKNHHNHQQQQPHHSSHRFSGNLKPTAAPIIGLPGTLGAARRHHHHHPAIFPKKAKTGGGGRQAKPAVPEPGSPKVSCFGKVASERERALRQRSPTREMRPSPPGCCGAFGFSVMRRSPSSRNNNAVQCVDQSPLPAAAAALVAARRRVVRDEEPEPPAPGLGGMRRFSSGRRAAEWAAAEMEDDGHVARSGPL